MLCTWVACNQCWGSHTKCWQVLANNILSRSAATKEYNKVAYHTKSAKTIAGPLGANFLGVNLDKVWFMQLEALFKHMIAGVGELTAQGWLVAEGGWVESKAAMGSLGVGLESTTAVGPVVTKPLFLWLDSEEPEAEGSKAKDSLPSMSGSKVGSSEEDGEEGAEDGDRLSSK